MLCYKHATAYDVKFNSSKSNTIIFSKCQDIKTQLNVKLGDSIIKTVTEVNHLGHSLVSNMVDTKHISLQCCIFNSKVNAILSDFKNVYSHIRISLIQSYCTSFYGAQLLNLECATLKQLAICWRKAVRKALGLPYMTHCNLIPFISNTLPFDVMIMKRLCKFYVNCINNNNSSLNFICRNSISQMYSTTCITMKRMAFYGNFSVYEFFKCQVNHIKLSGKLIKSWLSQVSLNDKCISNVINECIWKRDGALESCLSPSEVNCIIDNLCVI
jgi:hypothetical protein